MLLKQRAAAAVAEINVIPMADIMLVLLIIFMVITPILQRNGPPVDLAQVTQPRELRGADQEDAVFVTVARDGRVYVGTRRVSAEGVREKVRNLVANRADRTVYVKSDARARYGSVVGVVDEIRAAGVEQVALITEQTRAARKEDQRWE